MSRRAWRLVLVMASALVVVGVVTAYVLRPAEPAYRAPRAVPEPSSTPTLAQAPEPMEPKGPKLAKGPIWPHSIELAGVRAPILALGRDSAGVPATAPLTYAGMHAVAWDLGVRPGAHSGSVLLNAHTGPSGAEGLGNLLLDRLGTGDRITVIGGPHGRLKVVYRVTERVQIPASGGDTVGFYRVGGAPRIALIVCSGTRVGPGHWTDRTIWFAEPIRRRA